MNGSHGMNGSDGRPGTNLFQFVQNNVCISRVKVTLIALIITLEYP